MSDCVNISKTSMTSGIRGFAEIAAHLISGKLTKGEIETLRIVFNIEEFHALMNSLEEARNGEIVTLFEAFEDLNN